ncbi:hypothetical protein ACH50O_03120 [Methylomonas sp. 2BW1-5-20]|uniref:hypothetical protein n=1 Tax=Methylomonas sp. 2BW1-5-20 TaxID=3376686 RepID=UPI00404BDA77
MTVYTKILTPSELIWRFIASTACFWIRGEDGEPSINIKLVRLLWSELLAFANNGSFDFQELTDKTEVIKQAIAADVSDQKLQTFYKAWLDLWTTGETSNS